MKLCRKKLSRLSCREPTFSPRSCVGVRVMSFGTPSTKRGTRSVVKQLSYWQLNRPEYFPKRRIVWKLMVSALALAGAATIGALFALEGGETVAPSGYSRATLGAFAPAAVGQPPAGVSDGTPAAAPVNTPVAAAPTAAPSPAGSQIPDLKTVPAAPMGPDVTRIANQPPSATASGEAAQATDAAKPPIEPAPKVAGETGAIAQRTTPKLDLPTILSRKSSDHVVVARTRTTSRRARKRNEGDILTIHRATSSGGPL